MFNYVFNAIFKNINQLYLVNTVDIRIERKRGACRM